MKPADSASAAIRGATLAFQRDKLEQKQQQGQQQELSATRQPLGRSQSHVAAGRRDNGAYTAATEAVRSTANGSSNNTIGTRAHLVPGRTISTASAPEQAVVGLGASRPQQLEAQQQQQQRHTGGGGASGAFASQAAHLGLAPAAARMDVKNPSLIAATLAASRSASPTRAAAATAATNTTRMASRRAESVRTMSSASSAGGEQPCW
ncbi:uncharacterized protein TrAtP1_009610 [Trichoderma atroviride]|uniref:uncharacterized protein n=1 Tax=Hypocrea atroviridis TaxID=63577 RepID=UPI00331DC679|nr:hypothetical protein TrAtP1_009610 [Trichoderma atroviride]